MPLPGKPVSLWIDTSDRLGLPPLERDAEADACVLGAGITGLTAALELHRAGRSVVVLDMHEVGAGVTGHTTAKLQALHGTVYDQLRRRFGRDGAARYAAMNLEALDYVAAQVRDLGIDCAWRRKPAAVFAWTAKEAEELEAEGEAARAAGLPVRLTDDAGELPFPVQRVLWLDDQAELQARAYCVALARHLLAEGVAIHEQTTATHVGEGSAPVVRTAGGATVRARDVVVATHYPFLDRGVLFPRLTPKRSYALAVRAPRVVEGMYISVGAPTRSLRAHPDGRGGELLIVGGEGHNAGEEGDTTPERYRRLAAFAREHFGATEVTHRWSAHDMQTADGLPYAGRLTPLSRHVWVATGYRKWGLTNGTACGRLLARRITGQEDPFASLVDTTRFTPLRSAPGLLKEGAKDARHMVGDRLRKDAGPRCTHLGCRTLWNAAEETWDCPCHGSRFAVDGSVLQGPAVRPIPAEQLKTPDRGSSVSDG
ncbi:MAG: FAD-dependent oxidoreductase [Solirubrobacterales bacterium]|nr:FAD-dependent oxidoreductase [Solirubrobacterales bacterium]